MPLTADVRERLAADAREIIARYPVRRSALLPMLHLVQSEEGYVSPDGIALCAELLDLTTAEVSAVATFYTQFKRHPNGTYTVGVCTNTLCAVMGGDAIWEALEAHLEIGHDETTDDGKVTLERVECNAGCDYAPVVMVNWEFFDNQTPTSAKTLVDKLRADQPVVPTRGAARVCTFKEVSRVLAGFLDDHANEGVGAGPASLQGTLLARREGWTAPPREAGRTGSLSLAEIAAAQGASEAARRPARNDGLPLGQVAVSGPPPGQATAGAGDSGTGTTPPATDPKQGS
ncbi:MAG TPA: NADH-quinone oxidoreductase subunit NuoE [Kineosporiaceae bacterium]